MAGVGLGSTTAGLHGGGGAVPARHPPAPRTVEVPQSPPAAQPCTDPRPGPHPEPLPPAAPALPLTAPSGHTSCRELSQLLPLQRPSGKMARFPRPGRQGRLPCDLRRGWSWSPGYQVPHGTPEGAWKEGGLKRGSALAPNPRVKAVGPGHWESPSPSHLQVCLGHLLRGLRGAGAWESGTAVARGFPCGRA